jgi:lysophospholipase L1-like esterase
MFKLNRRLQILLVILLAVIAVALVGYAVHTGGTSRPGPSSAKAPTTVQPSVAVEPPVPSMLVLGDSAAAGAGASSASTAWVGRVAPGLGWKIVNRSVRGAGYAARAKGVGSCLRPQCPSFATILKRSAGQDPDVVLVAGGRDDSLVTTDTSSSTRALFVAIRKDFPKATIVALDPSYDTLFSGSATLADDVRSAVTRVKGTYADIGQPLVDHTERVASDGQNPNDMGHRAIARMVLAKLRNANLG